MHWDELNLNIYAFPPFSVIGRVLDKVIREKPTTMLLITPYWPTQAWFTTLLRLAKTHPIRLPVTPDLVLSSLDNTIHPLWDRLHLTAWII